MIGIFAPLVRATMAMTAWKHSSKPLLGTLLRNTLPGSDQG
jgi:hypothetical protein